MKKLIVTVVMVALLLTGCGNETVAPNASGQEISTAGITMVKVADGYPWDVYVHKETGVMYACYNWAVGNSAQMGLTVLLNADGTPMIWDGAL